MKSVGIDLDGVAYDWHRAVYNHVQLTSGYSGSMYEFWKVFAPSISEDEFDYLVTLDNLYSNCHPTQDTKDFLSNVGNRFEIFYITSRPLSVRLTTEQYLRRHRFPFHYNLFFTDDKVNAARRFKLSYFLEDSEKHIVPLSKIVFTIMRARPWNEHLWYQYPTVHSLMESLKYLED